MRYDHARFGIAPDQKPHYKVIDDEQAGQHEEIAIRELCKTRQEVFKPKWFSENGGPEQHRKAFADASTEDRGPTLRP